jgi:hypothetical protein
MDVGGLHLGTMEIIGAIVLLVVLLWAVSRVRSGGKKDSPARTEQATDELYREEERRREQGTDGV